MQRAGFVIRRFLGRTPVNLPYLVVPITHRSGLITSRHRLRAAARRMRKQLGSYLVRKPCCLTPLGRGLGQWLCVPLFRVVCPSQTSTHQRLFLNKPATHEKQWELPIPILPAQALRLNSRSTNHLPASPLECFNAARSLKTLNMNRGFDTRFLRQSRRGSRSTLGSHSSPMR